MRLQDQVRTLNLSDEELFEVGQKSPAEQVEALKARGATGEAPAEGSRPAEASEDRIWWDDGDHDDGQAFWWPADAESLCFDVPFTPAEDLTKGAPDVQQWWDVEAGAESENFMAVLKPPGMFVITSPKGLWEASPTNFIHVAHQRFEIPSRDEPRQRGICHRLDNFTSGVQIFGKSWEAFRHYVAQSSAHRVQKEYIALVKGRLGGEGEPSLGVVDVPMKKWQDFSRREFGSVVCAQEGVPAVTKYRALRQFRVPARGPTEFWGEERWFTLVQLRILTGRTHQLRVHMAFIGHPLVCDSKYNASNYEDDCAIVPRIFLHSTRMEFEDMNGDQFVACSDLASDLQVALLRLHELGVAEKSESGKFAASAVGFPGLTEILARTQGIAVEEMTAEEIAAAASSYPQSEVQRCRVCGGHEESQCSLVQRDTQAALYWTLKRRESGQESPAEAAGRAGEATSWGPGVLWTPSELQREFPANDEAEELRPPTDEELGPDWAPHGAEWTWAHDGERQNGWFHLHGGGRLATKWGSGSWRLLQDPSSSLPPLLLVTFNAVEHALRLELGGDDGQRPVRFAMVSKRRLGQQESLARQGVASVGRLFNPESAPCCETGGWPDTPL